MFDLDRLVADCRAAVAEEAGARAMREIVARAVADAAALMKRSASPPGMPGST